jgi:hypothetical protein
VQTLLQPVDGLELRLERYAVAARGGVERRFPAWREVRAETTIDTASD